MSGSFKFCIHAFPVVVCWLLLGCGNSDPPPHDHKTDKQTETGRIHNQDKPAPDHKVAKADKAEKPVASAQTGFAGALLKAVTLEERVALFAAHNPGSERLMALSAVVAGLPDDEAAKLLLECGTVMDADERNSSLLLPLVANRSGSFFKAIGTSSSNLPHDLVNACAGFHIESVAKSNPGNPQALVDALASVDEQYRGQAALEGFRKLAQNAKDAEQVALFSLEHAEVLGPRANDVIAQVCATWFGTNRDGSWQWSSAKLGSEVAVKAADAMLWESLTTDAQPISQWVKSQSESVMKDAARLVIVRFCMQAGDTGSAAAWTQDIKNTALREKASALTSKVKR